ncbi:MAG TPA: M50 family metallopeptidase [Myxococcales bacterium LLY-WYZ-16_1]|jgi:hypothetical protein|nr:M50 family metallopeptidase [Myxococcales bacterium LLY-WYZ-16_1]
MRRWILLGLALATIVAWQVPSGRLAVYPFTLLATYAHEMGHGISAWLLGGRFVELVLHPDGSGHARHLMAPSRIASALVAGGGLVGPSILGGLLLAASRRPGWARWLLALGAAGMAVSLVAVVRNPFGVVFVGTTAAGLAAVVRFAPGWCPFLLQLLAVQLGLSVFQDLDYMFSPGGRVAGTWVRSDTAAIQAALWLPYWFWGALTAAVSFAAVGAGAWVAFRPGREARRAL